MIATDDLICFEACVRITHAREHFAHELVSVHGPSLLAHKHTPNRLCRCFQRRKRQPGTSRVTGRRPLRSKLRFFCANSLKQSFWNKAFRLGPDIISKQPRTALFLSRHARNRTTRGSKSQSIRSYSKLQLLSIRPLGLKHSGSTALRRVFAHHGAGLCRKARNRVVILAEFGTLRCAQSTNEFTAILIREHKRWHVLIKIKVLSPCGRHRFNRRLPHIPNIRKRRLFSFFFFFFHTVFSANNNKPLVRRVNQLQQPRMDALTPPKNSSRAVTVALPFRAANLVLLALLACTQQGDFIVTWVYT
mmetsp:Transcript_12578/g.27410  ORF Transcript_12578/g.27410 Transcript_12578/m.27410 type:complete len:304 (+) Transcript_12578:318-1229(+)